MTFLKNALPLFVLFSFCFSNSITAQTGPPDLAEREVIWEYYLGWKDKQIASKKLVTEENCNAKYFKKKKLKTDLVFSIPADVYFDFGDINGDGKLDGLATFTPGNCGKEDANQVIQKAVLILSKGDGYYYLELTPTLSEGSEGHFYHFESVSAGGIETVYHSYKDGQDVAQENVFLKFKDDVLYNNGQKVDF